MASAPRVLVVDTNIERARALQDLLGASGFESTHSASISAALEALERVPVDVIFVAANDAGEIAQLLGEADHAHVIARIEDATVSVPPPKSWGVYELLAHDASSATVLAVIDRAVRDGVMRRELALLRSRALDGIASALIGRSSVIAHVRERVGRAAASQRTMLVTGEAGVGKDIVARLIHDLSERATRPYLLVRCSNNADTLLEELFGVARSSATLGRVGLLETARGGTVVLDDCTALSAGLRTRVAQAIVERTAIRLGSQTPVSLDVRFVLMARDPDVSGALGARADELLGSVSVDRIVVPPLRERRSDIPLLVQHFRLRLALEHGHEPTAPAANSVMTLMAQQWPGNVRELEHRVERDVYGAGEALPAVAHPETGANFSVPIAATWTLDQLERRYIEHVLLQEDGNQSRAADRLGIDRRTLYRKLKDYRDDGVELSQAG
ncbi:MAG: sigma 54-interacting transcriptional regulator [bacterium]